MDVASCNIQVIQPILTRGAAGLMENGADTMARAIVGTVTRPAGKLQTVNTVVR